MQIDYSTDVIEDDFDVNNGVSFTVDQDGKLSLMAFVELRTSWQINGLSVEERDDTILVSVLTRGSFTNNQTKQHRIVATIEPVTSDWQGNVEIVVKNPS